MAYLTLNFLIPTAMTMPQSSVVAAGSPVGPSRFVGPPAGPAPSVHPQAKSDKMERKRERLRAFLAWCNCCRFMGGSF